MSGNLENFLDQGECISEDMLMDYAEGRLSPQQAHAVEKHLLECEFCSDALEGLKMMKPTASKEAISDLNKEIDRRIQSTGSSEAKVIPFRFNYSVAAVIALFILFGGVFLYFQINDKEKILVQNNPPAASNSDSISQQLRSQTSSDQMSSEPVSTKPQLSLTDKDPVQQPGEMLVENKSVQFSRPEAAMEDDAKKEQGINSISGDVGKVSESDASAPSEAPVSETVKSVPARQRSASHMHDEKSKGEPAAAEGEVAPNDLFSLNVIFTKAKNNYNQKKFAEAATGFEKLLGDSSNSFYDDAKWMLANCYMRTSRNAKAVKLLREIAHSNSVHQKEAEDLLKELQ